MHRRAFSSDPDTTLALTLAYKGAAFHGFARQDGILTVQGDLEEALSLLFRRPCPTVCAGRTDAGVHARGQVVSFDVAADELCGRSLSSLRRSLDALTHDDIAIRLLEERGCGFSARFDAVSREYRYFLGMDNSRSLFMRDFSWQQTLPLDVEAMRSSADFLIGEHDFKSFCTAEAARGRSTFRRVHEISISSECVMGESLLCIKVVGNAFLHSMVRTIAGTLVSVGRAEHRPEWVGEVLLARDRKAAGATAPACGLCLWQVNY